MGGVGESFIQFLESDISKQVQFNTQLSIAQMENQNNAFEPCFLTPFAKIYWHSSRGLRHMPEVSDMSTASMPIETTSEIADEPHPFMQFLTYVLVLLI